MSYSYNSLVKSLPNILPDNIQVVSFHHPNGEEQEVFQVLVDHILNGEEFDIFLIYELCFKLAKFEVKNFICKNNKQKIDADIIRDNYVIYPRNRQYTISTANALAKSYFGEKYNLYVKSVRKVSHFIYNKIIITLFCFNTQMSYFIINDFIKQLNTNYFRVDWYESYSSPLFYTNSIQIELQ
jgi:hypothetical protein